MADSQAERLPSSISLHILGSLFTATILVFLLCSIFEPRWETNDDVGMSMVAHGYGMASIGSPNIIFSNILWGHFIRAIPEANGILGYSIATYGVLITVGTIVLFGLHRLGTSYLTSLFIFALILIRPILFPQFTINAGLLMVAAVICWHLYVRHNDWRTLLIGCLLAFISCLVRGQEFLLVLCVATPLLPWRSLFRSRISQIACLILGTALAVSTIIDHQAYQGDEWKAFNDLNSARAPFTDFGVGEHLKDRQDILDLYGFSANDIDLIKTWFFVDPKIADPKTLRNILVESALQPTHKYSTTKGWIGIQNLWHPALLPLLLVALLLAILRPSWRLTFSWGLCIIAVWFMGVLGRPGIIRVYIPLVTLLTIAPFLLAQHPTFKWRKWLGMIALFLAAIFNASHVFSESKNFEINSRNLREKLVSFPAGPVVIWGGAFPFESVYPVFNTSRSAMSYKFYPFGVFTLAPFSVAFAEEKAGRGFTESLIKDSGVSIIADTARFENLDIYCQEHFQGQLIELSNTQYGTVIVSRRRCVTGL